MLTLPICKLHPKIASPFCQLVIISCKNLTATYISSYRCKGHQLDLTQKLDLFSL